MTKENEIYAYFSIAEFDEEPSEITKRIKNIRYLEKYIYKLIEYF